MKLWKVITTFSSILIASLIPYTVLSAPKYDIDYNPCANSSYADNLFCSVNEYRKDNNLKNFTYSTEATRIAKQRADHLCETDTFTHDGWEKFLTTEYVDAGENLAKGFNNYGNVLEGWISSPAHNENLLRNFKSMGIYTDSCQGKNITAQIFITME